MTTFYHYTCDHGRAALGDDGTLSALTMRRPFTTPLPWWMAYVWLTDMATPMREALGLTANFTACDRTRYRYRVVDVSTVQPWTTVARNLSRDARDLLEASPGARPKHWYVSGDPVPVTFDPHRKAVRR